MNIRNICKMSLINKKLKTFYYIFNNFNNNYIFFNNSMLTKNRFFHLMNLFSIILILNVILINCIFTNFAHAAAKPQQQLDKIAAIVEEEIITLSELEDKLAIVAKNLTQQNITLPPKKILIKQVLEKLILDSIQLQLAKQLGIETDYLTINEIILSLAQKENLTINQFKQQLQEQGINFEDFKEQLKKDKIISKLHERAIIHDMKISNADIEGYLHSPAGQDNTGVEYRLGHILISGQETFTRTDVKSINDKVAQVMHALKQGKDFREVAASYSASTEALNGGDLGWRKLNQVPSIFVKQVMNMEVGQLSEPIPSKSGFHIIKLQNKRFNGKENYVELRAKQILLKSRNNMPDLELKKSLEEFKKLILESKKDFTKLAISKSEESSTSANGGDLGWFSEKTVLPEFWKQVNKLNIGEISNPFKTELGWHLVKLEGRRDASKLKDVMRNQIIEILKEQKFNEMLEFWLNKIRHEAQVKIFL